MREFNLFDSEENIPIAEDKIKSLFIENSKSARNKILEMNLPLINYVINKNFKDCKDKEDLFQTGATGLWKAILNFDIDKGFKFSTYAVHVIEGEIRRYLRDNKNIINISRDLRKLSLKIYKLQEKYSSKNNGKELSIDELSKLLCVSKSIINEAIISSYETVSIEENIYDNDKGDAMHISDVIFDPDYRIYDEVEEKEIFSNFSKILKEFSSNEVYTSIIRYYCGIDEDKKTQEEIANIVNISQAQVSRIIKKFRDFFVDRYSINIKKYDRLKPKETKTQKCSNKTIYEKLQNYETKIIDEEIDKLEEDKKNILLKVYPKQVDNSYKKIKISNNDQYKARYILKNIIYNLALRSIDEKDKTQGINESIHDSLCNGEEGIINMNINDENKSKINELVKYFNKSEEEILKALECLKPDNKRIMELKYGLNGVSIVKNEEIAKILSMDTTQIPYTISNIKAKMKKILGIQKEFKVDKKGKYNGKTIDVKNKLLLDFPNDTKEDIIEVVNKLSKRKKEIFVLSYGLEDGIPLKNSEIMEKLNLSEKNTSQQLYWARKEVREKLMDKKKQKKDLEKNQEAEESIEIKQNFNKYRGVADFGKVIDLIKSGKYDNKEQDFLLGNLKIGVKTTIGDCSLAFVNTRFLYLDEPRSIKKKCYIYKVTLKDENEVVLRSYTLVKEINEKRFYEVIKADKSGMWIFDDLMEDCVVCYKIENEKEIDILKEEKINDKKVPLEEYIQNLYSSAIKMFEEREFVLSEANFSKLLAISNDDNIIYNCNLYLGRIYNKRKKYIVAEKYYNDALSYIKDYFVLIELAKIETMQGKYSEALKIFDECSKLNSKYTHHLVGKAKTLGLMGENSMALQTLDECISYKKDEYIVHLEKAIIFYKLNKYKEAINEIEICEQKRPGFNQHMLIKGKIKYNTGNKTEAFDIFNKCVENDVKRGVMHSIIAIGYFFHEMGEKDLAYRYYEKTPMFPSWEKLTDNDINDHFKKHNSNGRNEKMHSVFNVDISPNELQKFIKNMKKTGIKELYDVYQIYWPNVGYMQVDDNVSMKEDYLTIFTLPFTKKIMMCYPDFKFNGTIINEPVSIDEIAYEAVDAENVNNSTNVEKIEDCKPIHSCEALNNDSDNKNYSSDTVYKDDDSEQKDQPNYKDADTNVEVTLIPKGFDIPTLNSFEENKENFRALINLLSDPSQQVVLLLSLGYVEGKRYTNDEISKMLGISKEKIDNIINDGFSNIMSLSAITINSVESARKQLRIR